MKKAIFILSMAILPAICFSQKADTTKKATPPKPQYEKFYKVSEQAYQLLMQWGHAAKDGVIYSSILTPQEKLNIQLNIDNSLDFIAKNTKLDSLLIKQDASKKPNK